jgi:hypothetical protein
MRKLWHEHRHAQPMRRYRSGWIRENSFQDRALDVHKIETHRLNHPALPAGAGAKQKGSGSPLNILSHRSPELSPQAGTKSLLLCRVRQLYGGSHRDGAAGCVARVAGRLQWVIACKGCFAPTPARPCVPVRSDWHRHYVVTSKSLQDINVGSRSSRNPPPNISFRLFPLDEFCLSRFDLPFAFR